MTAKTHYTVKQLAKLAGVSVRTLHLYDGMELLKPSVRTDAGYRKYGDAELLRLQQILFYRELGMPLKEIGNIIDDPEFNIVAALKSHKAALTAQRNRLNTMLKTIDKTIENLNNRKMPNVEELYEGLPKEQAMAWREEAIEKWGKETIERSERALLEMDKVNLEQLKADQKDIAEKLKMLRHEDPKSPVVQEQIARHYRNIRGFWGVTDTGDLKAAAYKGLAELYVTDERYTAANGQPDKAYAQFMRNAMVHFADNNLL